MPICASYELSLMNHEYNSVLTGVGKLLPKTEPAAPQTSRVSRKSPTGRDRSYTDHTLSTCKPGFHHQKLYEPRAYY